MNKDYERGFIRLIPFFLICLAIAMFSMNGWLTNVLIVTVGILVGTVCFLMV